MNLVMAGGQRQYRSGHRYYPLLVTALVLSSVGLALHVGQAQAHHSRATYNMTEIHELEGEITAISWKNPHVGFTVSVVDENGNFRPWRIEGWGSVYTLKRTGVTSGYFAVGQHVRLAGYLSTVRDNDMLVSHIQVPSGGEVVLRPDAEPHWGGAYVGGQSSWSQGTTGSVGVVAATGQGLFRVWSPSGTMGSNSTATTHYPFTQAAIDGRADWDPLDNFVMRCEPNGMPRAMIAPHPWEFINQGDTILLRLEIGDVTRTIHMTDTNQETPAPSPLGYSLGHWQNGSLVVRTAAINWPYFDAIGTRQSESIEIVEWFTPGDDGVRLLYQQTIIDPVTFSEPATYETWRLSLGESVDVYDCQANQANME